MAEVANTSVQPRRHVLLAQHKTRLAQGCLRQAQGKLDTFAKHWRRFTDDSPLQSYPVRMPRLRQALCQVRPRFHIFHAARSFCLQSEAWALQKRSSPECQSCEPKELSALTGSLCTLQCRSIGEEFQTCPTFWDLAACLVAATAHVPWPEVKSKRPRRKSRRRRRHIVRGWCKRPQGWCVSMSPTTAPLQLPQTKRILCVLAAGEVPSSSSCIAPCWQQPVAHDDFSAIAADGCTWFSRVA